MADRYWVGGTGSWDATTTNWSATSGGAGGASVPTSVDDVFFDTLSNATLYTCTLTTSPVCRSVSVVGPVTGNVTIAGNTPWVIYGSFTLAATGVTITFSNGLYFNATTTGWTVTTNGISLPCALQFQAAGGWSLGSALTTTNFIALNIGTFSTANFNITTTGTFSSLGTTYARTINLGSSAISCAAWNALGATSLTVNAGTSTITLTGAAGNFSGGGLTYYNVTRTNNGFAIGDAGNTFNALTNTTNTLSQTLFCSFVGNQTIGTLTINGGSNQLSRIGIQSLTPGVQITLTVASFVTNGYVDFRDINLAGAASPLTVATGGDCGNNTNITLQTPKTVYWSAVGGGNWSTNAFALTSGGAPAVANYPLPQDTVIIQDTGLNSGATITIGNANIGTIDISGRTLPMTFSTTGVFPSIYGNVTYSSVVTTTTGTMTFSGYNKTQTFTSAGVSVLTALVVNGTSTTFTLGGTLTCTNTITFTLGTLNLANYNLTCNAFNSSTAGTRLIAFGTGQIYVTGSNGFYLVLDDMTGFTYTGSGVFNYTYSGSVGGRFVDFGNSGGATESNALNINITAGTDNIAIYGLGLKNINFTGFAGTWVDYGIRTIYGDLTISTGMSLTVTNATSFSGSGTQNITSNGKTLTFPINKNGAGTLRLVDALTLGSTLQFSHNVGTLDLNNNNLTCGLFNTNNSNTRTLAFGTGQIYLTGNNATIWTFNNGSGLTVTGSAIVNATYSGSVGTRLFLGYGVGSAQINVNVTAGTDILSIPNNGYNNVSFVGFTGSCTTVGPFGNLTLGAGMTISSATAFALQGSGTFTSNGVLFDAPLNVAGTGYTLADNLTVGSTRLLQLFSGTLNLNAKTLTTGLFNSTGTGVRSIAFNGGTITTSGATFTASGSGFTTSGTGTINMTSASSKTFTGNGVSYPTLNQGGAGALTITGANTFRTIANTVAPATITLPASTITSIAGFDLIGSAGNLITLNSSTSGTQATINNTTGGRIGGDYLSYQDTNATPASTISAGANSTSVSNNTGWLTTPVVSVAIAESFSLYVPVTFKANSTFSGAPFGSVPIVGGIDITFNMYDYFQSFLDQFGSVNDAITLSNAQNSQVDFKPTNAESLTLTDAQSTQVAFVSTNTEFVTFTDAQSSQVSFVSTNAESITLADAQAGIRGQFGTTAEAITFTNTQAALAAFAPQVAELLTLTELISIQSNLVGYTAETIVFTDTQIQRGWTKIINSQTPNWTNINDYQ